MFSRLRRTWKATRMAMQGFSRNQAWETKRHAEAAPKASNPLRAYFDAHSEGRGIWKWNHYFDIYHRHFQKFVGHDVHVLEIGIYSGGSLEMWKSYFGPKSRVYGVDIEEDCKAYEDDSVKVFLGDQADRSFWRHFKNEVATLDVVIDDGGHEPQQQIVTLEEILPHLRPGGVYLCEDVHGMFNDFASYINGFVHHLNATRNWKMNQQGTQRRSVCQATEFQSIIHSVHLYPYVVVIEKCETPVGEFVAPKQGTQWQPFLS